MVTKKTLQKLFSAILVGYGLLAMAQAQPAPATADEADQAPSVSDSVEIRPGASDSEIGTRLERIMAATGWFTDVTVDVDQGVVVLNGMTDTEAHTSWASQLARNTENVVAVVNNIEIEAPSFWDLSPAFAQMRALSEDAIRAAPMMLLALVLLALTWMVTGWSYYAARALLGKRLQSRLLQDVATRALSAVVFILGIYIVLKVSGLTGLAITVVGGTGLVGLAIGFAFRDIAENFLASILLSMQRPFATGDLIEVAGHEGYVQSVNTRATLIMTMDGNHVQIPNATVYKMPITNFTANPNARHNFTIGIGYDDKIEHAQSVALEVLREHPAVVDDPEPLVLVDTLGAATVNLRIYFWVDISRYSGVKVRSAVIRLTKNAFDAAGISMPDEAREVVFPAGVPVQMVEQAVAAVAEAPEPAGPPATDDSEPAHAGEGDLSSEAAEIDEQARQSRQPEGGENLLD